VDAGVDLSEPQFFGLLPALRRIRELGGFLNPPATTVVANLEF